MKEHLLSVVVPIYNVEPYLERCIDSLLEQTYERMEILLVDDGSTDGSGEIADRYERSYEKIRVFHKENGGLSDARNYGLERAKGDYIYLMDSDDYLVEKDALSVLYDWAIQKEVAVVVGAYCEERKGKLHFFTPNQKSKVVIPKEEAIANMYRYDAYKSIFVVAQNKLYKKEMLEHYRYPKGKLHEDEFTTYKIYLEAEAIGYVDYVTYAYVMRSGSIMTAGYRKERKAILEALEERIEVLQSNDMEIFDTQYYYLNALYFHRYMLEKYGFYEDLEEIDEKIHSFDGVEFRRMCSGISPKRKLKLIILKYFYKKYFRFVKKV